MKTFKKNKKSINFKKKCSHLKKMRLTKLKLKNKQNKIKYSKLKGGARSLFAPIRKDTLASGHEIPRKNPSNLISLTHEKVPIENLEENSKEKEHILQKKKAIERSINDFFNQASNLKMNPSTSTPSKIFELIEATNTFFQIKYNYYNAKNEYKPLFFFVNPDVLSVDKLQYFIDNDKIKISDDNKNIQISENTIILKSLRAGGHYRTGNVIEKEPFKNVYEDTQIPLVSYETNLGYLLDPRNGKYHINVLGVEFASLKPKNQSLIVEDIASWIKEIMRELNNSVNLDLFLEKSKTEEGKTTDYKPRLFRCVDLDVDHSKLIIDKYTNPTTNEEYVIVGYPKDTMRPYLDLYNKNKAMFDNIYQKHKDEFMTYMAELHNIINVSNPNNQINMSQLTTEIHKFYGYESYYKYTSNFYENEKENFGTDVEHGKNGLIYDPEFQIKFKALQKAFYNELASKCLNKPMMQIQYIFLIFKKNSDGNYTPAVFNFRELNHEHHSLLQRLEIVIKTILPYRYGITSSEAEDYKLWYSHYNYGDIFHIKTEYVHTMSNIQQQAYKYKNSITLEELIYMLSIPDVDLINLRVDYQRKKVNFQIIDGKTQSFHEGLATREGGNTYYRFTIETETTPTPTRLNLSTFLNSKILLMFTQTGKLYTFIYKKDGIFYIIKFKPSLYNIIIKIFDTLKEHILNQEFMTKILNSRDFEFVEGIDIPNIDLYEVLEHRPIISEDYKNIMRYNPLLIRTIKKQNTENKVTSLCSFFQTQILEKKDFKCNDIEIPNPYIKKPFLIRNILATEIYKREFNIFKDNISKNNFYHAYRPKETDDPYYKSEYENDIIDILNDKYQYSLYEGIENNTRQINRIYFNPNNCGYTLIDIYEQLKSGDFKSVIWIVPLNATFNETMTEKYDDIFSKVKYIGNYIGNFIYLNNNHINMINQVKKRYLLKDTFCNLNIQSKSPSNFCLHFHILKKVEYKSKFSYFEQGSRVYAMLDLNTILNNILLFNQYYNLLDINIILHNDN